MTQAEIVRKLHTDGKIKFTRQYFAKLVSQGKIPFKEIDGKKDFKYKKVVKALSDMKQRMPDGQKFNPKNEDGSEKTLNSTKVMLQEYQAKLAKQKFDVEAGKLVYKDDVEQKAFTVMRVLRDQLLSLPERITAEIMGASDITEGKELFFKELNEVLEFLSDEAKLYD